MVEADDLARFRAPDAKAREGRRDVVHEDGAVTRHVPLEPRPVVRPERRPGDEQEAILAAAHDRKVRLDAAAMVEELRVHDRADGAVDAVRAQPFEEGERSRAEHLELRERRLVEERDRLARRPRFDLDRRRPVLAGPAARPQRLVAARGIRPVPVDALPAALLPEGRVQRDMPLIHRRYTKRAPRPALLAWVLDVVVLRQRLIRARERVRPAAVLPAEAAPVERPNVPLGTAVDDPLAHHLSD